MMEELPLRNLHASVDEVEEGDDQGWGDDEEDHFVLLQRNDPKLHNLNIGSDDFFELPHDDDWERTGQCIGDHEHLKELCLGAMDGVGRDKLEAMCRGVARNRSITHIEFTHVNLFGGKEFEMLTPFFMQNDNLEHLKILDFSDTITHFDPEGIRLFFTALSRFHSLTEIIVPFISIGEKGAGGLLKALVGHVRLRTLDLMGNDIGSSGCTSLASLLKIPTSELRSLKLFSNSIDDEGAAVLADGLAENNTLKCLHLGRNTEITETGWRAIFAVLQSSSCTLEELDLSEGGLDNDAVVSLVNSLSRNSSIKTLNLSFHDDHNGNISRTGWQAFFAFLQTKNASLEYLRLRGEDFSDDDAISMANALTYNSKLRELDISGNDDITIRGWRAISSALESTNTALEKLNLRWSTVNNDDAAIVFANSLANNRKLTELNVASDGGFMIPAVTTRGWAAFTTALCNNSSIIDTYLSNHTLNVIRDTGGNLPPHLRGHLQLNRDNSKTQAARLKIIKCHFNNDSKLQPLTDLDAEILPHAIAWMGRDSERKEGIRLLYRFVRSMPVLFCISERNKKRKRKTQTR